MYDVDLAVDYIRGKVDVIGSIYLFENKKSKSNVYLTYNTNRDDKKVELQNTISIHRRSDLNVLYTINALNELIKTINNNVFDYEYNVDWEMYKDTFIMYRNSKLEFIPLELIFKFK